MRVHRFWRFKSASSRLFLGTAKHSWLTTLQGIFTTLKCSLNKVLQSLCPLFHKTWFLKGVHRIWRNCTIKKLCTSRNVARKSLRIKYGKVLKWKYMHLIIIALSYWSKVYSILKYKPISVFLQPNAYDNWYVIFQYADNISIKIICTCKYLVKLRT